jgi:hypothetical protein
MRSDKTYDIRNNAINISLKMNDMKTFKGETDYPVLYMPEDENAEFNRFYRENALNQQKYIISQIMEPAMEEISGQGMDIQNQWIADYHVTYNKGSVISMYNDQFQYTGGAHGITMRTSQTWLVPEGRQMELWEFFHEDADYAQKLKREIKRQVKERRDQDPSSYFENYGELIEQNFKPQNFFIKENPSALIIYFEPYEIAPHSTGIPEFAIGLSYS